MESGHNILTGYKEASALMKKSSRGKNPDWYRDAILLDHQLHLLPTGDGFRVYLLEAKTRRWKTELNSISETMPEEALASYIETLRKEHLPKDARSLGVVLHLNKEAAVFEFPYPEVEGEIDLLEFRKAIVSDPAYVMQDRTLDNHSLSFRIYPTPGAAQADKIGCAVATSHFGSTFLRRLRELGNRTDFPIRTHALSSPLLLLSRLPRTFGIQEQPYCVMLRFDEFSFFGFYHPSGELILFRTLKHAKQELPPNLESILRTTAAAVELHQIELRVFDCRQNQSSPLEAQLQQLIYDFHFEIIPAPEAHQTMPIELNTYLIDDQSEALAYRETASFGKVLKDKWHLQDFLPETSEELANVPGPIDMKLLRAGRMIFRGGLAAMLAMGAFVAWSTISKMTSKAWKYPQAETQKAAQYTKQLNNVKLLENLLADRSKGWTSMELLSRIFPLDGNVRYSSVEHTVNSEKPPSASFTQAAIVKTWRIKGLAKNEAYDRLAGLDSDSLRKIFKDVYETTGSSSYDLSKPTRNIVVNLDWAENTAYNQAAPKTPDESFRYQFTLEINQRIESADELALPVAKIQS